MNDYRRVAAKADMTNLGDARGALCCKTQGLLQNQTGHIATAVWRQINLLTTQKELHAGRVAHRHRQGALALYLLFATRRQPL